MAKKYEIDMINGPLFGKIIRYSLPLIAAGILQLMFNAADMVVVGRYAGANALGAVGATASLINLLINVFMGLAGWHFGRQLLSIYTDDNAVIEYGLRRMAVIFPTYFQCGLMEVIVGSLRGMGFSIVPMTVSLLGACGFRILWILTVFSVYHSPEVLYASYPISWFITALVHMICLITVARKKYSNLKTVSS